MEKIKSRSSTKENGIDLRLSNQEIILILGLLHCSSIRTYGNSYAYHAYTLAEKLVGCSGISTSAAASIVEPAINVYDDHGNFSTTYHYTEFTVVYK